jgi:hypothetical protein
MPLDTTQRRIVRPAREPNMARLAIARGISISKLRLDPRDDWET